MAGFMAGFGAGFTRSFEQTRDQQAQKESDMFKLKYADYVSQRDKREELKREDAKNVKLAKSIVGMMPDQPQEAWTYAADLLRNGMSQEQVMKQFRENQAIVAPKANEQVGTAGGNNPADPREDLTQSASNSVNAQMTASGMQKPQGDGIFGNIQQILKGPDMEGKVNRRIAETAGISEQQLNDTITDTNYNPEPLAGSDDYQIAWKPKAEKQDFSKVNNLNDAIAYDVWASENGSDADKMRAKTLVDAYNSSATQQAKNRAIELGNYQEPTRAAIKDQNGGWAGGFANLAPDGNGGMVWKDPQGNTVSEENLYPISDPMEKEIKSISEKMGPDFDKYNEATGNFMRLNRVAGKITKLSKQVPAAMDISGQVLNTFERYKQAGVNIFQTITGQSGSAPLMDKDGRVDISGSMLSKLDEAEKIMEKDLNGPLDRVSKTALAASLLDIQATKLAYMYAATLGQSGRSVSQQEFEAFKHSAMGGGKVEGLQISAADFIQDQYKAIKDQERTLAAGSMAAKNFQQRYNMPSPIRLDVGVDDLINGDPEVKENFEQSKTDLDKASFNQTSQTKSEPLPDMVKKNYPDIDEATWKEMDPEQKKLFTGE